VVFGLLGVLPVLGFWMVPIGLIILAIDFPFARRINRRMTVWLHRRLPGLMRKLSRLAS